MLNTSSGLWARFVCSRVHLSHARESCKPGRCVMVYIHSWQEFQDAAETLYSKSQNKACLHPIHPVGAKLTDLSDRHDIV